MKVLIICSGTLNDMDLVRYWAKWANFILCADGGAKYTYQARVTPDLLVGDFDSIDPLIRQFYMETQVPCIVYPKEKDMTDSELALSIAMEKHPTEIALLGATGTRLDHSLANIFLLQSLAEQGVQSVIIDQNNEIRVLNDSIRLYKQKGMKVSLLPLTNTVTDIFTKGLQYELRGEQLDFSSTRGVSNEFVAEEAEISIKEGSLLVILSKD